MLHRTIEVSAYLHGATQQYASFPVCLIVAMQHIATQQYATLIMLVITNIAYYYAGVRAI